MLTFPQLYTATGADANVVYTQFPYEETDEWYTSETRMDCGLSVTFPGQIAVRRRFTLSYDMITRNDVTTLETFFNTCKGRLANFTFIDDQGQAWDKTNFDQDEIEIRYVEPAHYSTTLKLIAQNPGNISGAQGGDNRGGSGADTNGFIFPPGE